MEIIMDKPSGQSRRDVLQALASAGAAVTAAALPANAQESTRGPAPSANQGTIAQTPADHAPHLRYEDLPAEVVRTVKRTIIDTIGCAIGGYDAGPSQIARKLARNVSATPSATSGATLFCSGEKTSHELAVFANGVMIRFLDFNDGYIT